MLICTITLSTLSFNILLDNHPAFGPPQLSCVFGCRQSSGMLGYRSGLSFGDLTAKGWVWRTLAAGTGRRPGWGGHTEPDERLSF
jgi:hypothetical protein